MRRSRRLAALLAVALLAAGCAGPIMPEPSNACGGVHLLVRNEGSGTVAIRIDGAGFGTVAADDHVELIQFFTPGLADLAWPWTVEIVDTGTGAVLATREVPEDVANESAVIEVTGGTSGVPAVSGLEAGPGC
jgi:hypothetical protein